MARVAWVLEDLVTNETYSWEINPKDLTLPRRKSLSYVATAAPGGRVVAYEGRDEPRKMTYSGTILTEEQYDNLTTWFEKRNLLKLTDDLGREYGVYITSFEIQRSFHSAQYPWRHNYSGEMLLIDWAVVTSGTVEHTYSPVSIFATDPGLISGFEAGNGYPPGSIADLVALNPSGISNMTTLNGSGWNLDEWGGKTMGMFSCNFGPLGDIGLFVSASFTATFTTRGGAPQAGNTFWLLLVDMVGPDNTIGTAVFSAQMKSDDWTEDGQTVVHSNDFTEGQPALMNNYISDLGTGDCIGFVVVQLEDDGSPVSTYLPGVDHIQLTIVGTA